jgi:hypothetical protein
MAGLLSQPATTTTTTTTRPVSSIVFFMVQGLRQRVSSGQFLGLAVRSILDSPEVAPAACCCASRSACACILAVAAFCCAIRRATELQELVCLVGGELVGEADGLHLAGRTLCGGLEPFELASVSGQVALLLLKALE